MLPNYLGLSFYFTINRFSLMTSSPERSSLYSCKKYLSLKTFISHLEKEAGLSGLMRNTCIFLLAVRAETKRGDCIHLVLFFNLDSSVCVVCNPSFGLCDSRA